MQSAFRLAGALLLGATATAQDRVLVVQNLAPMPRREWVGAVVPFARGMVKTTPELHVGRGPTVWQPIGARWSDGSLRQALCLFPLTMRAMSEVRLRLLPGKGPALFNATIRDPVRAGTAKVSIDVIRGAQTETANPTFVRLLEDNAARQVALYRCRIGTTGLVFELIVHACAGQEHCYVDLALFFSDPSSKAMQVQVDRVVVRTRGTHLVLRHAGLLAMETAVQNEGTDVTLLANRVLGDGQGIRRTGVLAPKPAGDDPARDQTLRAAALLPILAATSWRSSKAYGPFGYVPEAPPWLRGRFGRIAMARRHRAFVAMGRGPGDPFRELPFGLTKTPGQTGRQEDFGILKLAPVASTGIPSFLYEVEPSVLQEACRPVHFFEADGTRLRARNHPNWVQWDGRTHWNCEVSTDRLGKPCPVPRFQTNGWVGKDRQHWSSNYLCGYYLLTGSHAARREIENEVQLFLGGQTVRAGVVTSGPGVARGAGRMLLLGCWLYQCTGDQELLARMHARVRTSHLSGFAGRDLAPDKVRILSVRGPDPRALGGSSRWWAPWEESLAAVGYAAFYHMTGDAIAGQIADAISTSVLRWGWQVNERIAQVGYHMKWNDDGAPLTEEERRRADPSVCRWAGGGISQWAMGAVEVAHQFAKLRNDKALVDKAEMILTVLRRGKNRVPDDKLWGDFYEWDAVGLWR